MSVIPIARLTTVALQKELIIHILDSIVNMWGNLRNPEFAKFDVIPGKTLENRNISDIISQALLRV